MSDTRRKYTKKAGNHIIAVQLDLETEGFTYEKWGSTQRCKAKDWLVNNDGETYTVDDTSFRRTYEAVAPGQYAKVTPVWAERATTAGVIQTLEGITAYRAGDYVVYNEEDGTDGYAVKAALFERMYEPVR